MSQLNDYVIFDHELEPNQIFEKVGNSSIPQILLSLSIQLNRLAREHPPSFLKKPIGLFTSGTTYKPKCIWNSYEHLIENALLSAEEFEIQTSDRLLIMAKPWHVAGLSWGLMAIRMECDYCFIITKKGRQKAWLKAVKEYNSTHLFTVPAVLRSLYAYKNWFVPNIIYGGSPIDQWDYPELKKHAKTLYQGYGQTEAGGLISCHKVDVTQEISATEHHCYGRPHEKISVQCKGTEKNPSPIRIKSPTAVFDDFYDTGDEGYIDSEGRIHLLRRKKGS